jgi:hypothetical protein
MSPLRVAAWGYVVRGAALMLMERKKVLKKQRRSKKKIDRKVILVAKAGFEIR